MSDNAAIDFECPQCQKRLRAPGSAAGKRIRCPKCSNVIAVPAETATTAAPPKLSPKAPPPPPPPEPESHDEPSRDDDESDRSRRRRRLTRADDDDDDDESDRPRRKRRSTRDDDDDEDDDDELDRPRPGRRSTRDDDDDDYSRDNRLGRRLRRRPSSAGLIAAAICLLIIGSLGLLVDLLGAVMAIAGPEQPINPQDPPFMQQIARNAHGPLASAMQAFFALLSVVTIVGSIQMLRQKTWGLALAACILSMINLGNCCCFLGLPVGIWAMIMLLSPEIQEGFS